MAITFPKPHLPKPIPLKPRLLRPGIGGLITVGLLAAQYILLGPGTSPEPKCSLAESSSKDRTKAYFLDLILGCKESLPIMYGGYAEGSVLLSDGQKIPVKGFSKEFKAVPCAVKAK